MAYTPDNFTTSAVINNTTLFQNYDEEIQQLMTDSGTYLENQSTKMFNNLYATTTHLVVEDIATLKLKGGENDNEAIDVLGYYTKGDGGGGLFYWDSTSTETDNGGTIIQATGVTTGRWKRPIDETMGNVKKWGAKGDGITDDSTAIVNACKLYNVQFIDGEFVLNSTVQLKQYHHITFKNARVIYNGNSIAFDLYTDNNNDLDFDNHPIIENPNIVGNPNALGGIRINSTLDAVIRNYESSGFSNIKASALIFRNVAYGSFQGFCETYNVYGLASNFNQCGIKFEVSGGTTSFGYGYIQGKITPKVGTAGSESKIMDIQTTQLYNTSIDLSVWSNGYCNGIVIGNSTTAGRMYWCNLYIRGEAFNTNNNSFDLTYGEVFGCTGFANINNGSVANPNNKRLEIYGQYQRTNYGNTTKKINGIDTKLTPLMASFQVEDAFNGRPEAGFGVASGNNNMRSPIIWMQDAVFNSFRVSKAGLDSEPSTDDYVFDAYYDGTCTAKLKYKAPKFVSYEATFYADGSTTTTQVFDVGSLIASSGTYMISCYGFGANTNLAISGIMTFSPTSYDIICPVTTLTTQDYNLGSIALQTYGNLAANTYSAGNGRKFQIAVTNANATQMLMDLTITRIG